MKNKRSFRWTTIFFLLTVLVAFLSWVGSIYGWEGVQNLLSPEGFRWKLRHLEDDYLHAPFLGSILVVSFGVGLCLHSGLWSLCFRLWKRTGHLTRKERRALTLTAIVAALYALACAFLAWGPWNGVRSIMGTLTDSPLQDGAFFLLSFGAGLFAVVYAYAADSYNSDMDIVEGMAYGGVCLAPYLVTLFFVVQFFTAFQYAGLAHCCGLSDAVYERLYSLCCLSLLWPLLSDLSQNGGK